MKFCPITDYEVKKIKDEYDLRSIIGKFTKDANISIDAKDAIKEFAIECFNIGLKIGEENGKS